VYTEGVLTLTFEPVVKDDGEAQVNVEAVLNPMHDAVMLMLCVKQVMELLPLLFEIEIVCAFKYKVETVNKKNTKCFIVGFIIMSSNIVPIQQGFIVSIK
jgi:hypothetical protein